MKEGYSELVSRLRELAEWAEGNIWEIPIDLPDRLTEVANALEYAQKCNPGDEFDFYKGAKLAFKRLVGDMDEAEVRPSKKCKFKVGDIIIGNEKANRYSITVKGWVGEVTEVHEPKPGYGCDAGHFKTFEAKSVTGINSTEYDLDDDCFDLAANSR